MKLFARKYSSLYVIMGALLFQTLTLSTASADIITLETANMGYYWSQRSTWSGGSSTDSGFSYGDDAGLQHVQNNYQYYGGSDRYWQQKDLYFQIDLSSIPGDLEEAVFHFYVQSTILLRPPFSGMWTPRRPSPQGTRDRNSLEARMWLGPTALSWDGTAWT